MPPKVEEPEEDWGEVKSKKKPKKKNKPASDEFPGSGAGQPVSTRTASLIIPQNKIGPLHLHSLARSLTHSLRTRLVSQSSYFVFILFYYCYSARWDSAVARTPRARLCALRPAHLPTSTAARPHAWPHRAGILIGPKGETLMKFQDAYGVRINIPRQAEGSPTPREVSIAIEGAATSTSFWAILTHFLALHRPHAHTPCDMLSFVPMCIGC